MSAKPIQISAIVSEETKLRLEALTRARGLKKAWVIETALNHYLQALDALPPDVMIPPRLIVDRETGEHIVARIGKPARPTAAMRDLFAE